MPTSQGTSTVLTKFDVTETDLERAREAVQLLLPPIGVLGSNVLKYAVPGTVEVRRGGVSEVEIRANPDGGTIVRVRKRPSGSSLAAACLVTRWRG